MGKSFDNTFSEACQFWPSGWHVSRRLYDADLAACVINRDVGIDIDITELKKSWVRFQFAGADLRDELGVDHCWMIVPEGTKGAMPTWVYELLDIEGK